MDIELLKKIVPYVKLLRTYHRHKVVGLENIPKSGACILAVNHSLATYDMALLFEAIYEHNGRVTRALVDRLFFKIPVLGQLVETLGGKQGNPDHARKLLEKGELLAVAPGGMREALRPSSERYQIRWDKRRGFARIAMETGTPIVLATCPKADDLYEIYPNTITPWVYKNFKIPLFVARGIGPSPIPRPVQLIHFLSEPLLPPPMPTDPSDVLEQLERFHQKIVKRMEKLIGEAVAYRKKGK